MATTLQLLASYYKAVIESERIYNESVARGSSGNHETNVNNSEPFSGMVKEMLLLQRQISQLTMENQVLRKENDTLKELQKTQRALMESKLNNCKKTIEKLKRNNKTEIDSTDPAEKVNFHLLSPLNVRKLNGVSTQIEGDGILTKPTSLRHVITNRQHTLFDADNSIGTIATYHHDDSDLIRSLKKPEELAKIVLPRGALSETEESADRSTSTSFNSNFDTSLGKRKRKLARKRIRTGDSESDSECHLSQMV